MTGLGGQMGGWGLETSGRRSGARGDWSAAAAASAGAVCGQALPFQDRGRPGRPYAVAAALPLDALLVHLALGRLRIAARGGVA